MPTPETCLPIRCPHCQHDEAVLVMSSRTVLTVTCKGCAYTWALDLEAAPEAVRHEAQIFLLARDFSRH